ncbi:MAG: ChaN family lipoprotein, partial [Planctomycetota bacterium]
MTTRFHHAAAATLALLAASLLGCAQTSKGDTPPLTISPTPWQTMIADAAAADVVIIGEQHSHPVGLPMMAQLFADTLAEAQAAGHTPALALEFIERDHQLALDDYLAGLIDEETFADRTNRTETNYPAAHRDMVEAARAANLPVYAANAPRRYVRMARTEGFDRLRAMTPAQRETFVIPDPMTTGPYRDRFFDLFRKMMGGGPNSSAGASAKEAAAEQAQG